jgi:hypothetical protein
MDNELLAETSNFLAPRREKFDGGFLMLLAIAVGTVLIWRLPWGNELLWPFTLLATWYHEMGHALTAMLLGGEVLGLHIYPNGSGLAIYQSADLGRIGRALVAAGGPVAPAVAGGAMIVGSRNVRATRVCLSALAAMLMLSALFWISWWESLVGALAIFALGLTIMALAFVGGNFLRTFILQLCGVQACISLWRHWSYFFTSVANVDGREQHSDAAVIAQALWLPTWFWGLLLTAFSLAVLLLSLWIAFRPHKESDFALDVAV